MVCFAVWSAAVSVAFLPLLGVAALVHLVYTVWIVTLTPRDR